MNCDCDCDWAELCAALRTKSATCGSDCDWAEPCAALSRKFELRLRLRLS